MLDPCKPKFVLRLAAKPQLVLSLGLAAPAGVLAVAMFTAPAPVFAATAQVDTTIAAAASFTAPRPTFTATIELPTDAAASFTAPAPTFSAAGEITAQAQAAFTAPRPTFGAAAEITSDAAASFTAPAPTFSAAATVQDAAVEAQAAFTAPRPTFGAAAEITSDAAASFTAPAPTFSAVISPADVNAAANFTAPRPVFASTAEITATAIASFTAPTPAFSAQAAIITYGPLTIDYEGRVIAAGGAVSTNALNLVEAFFYGTYGDGASGTGRVADFASLFPFLWMPASNFAGILVPLLGANFTSSGFVAGDWNIQGGLQCGTGKHLSTNWETGSFTSTNSAGMGYWTPNTTTATAAQIAIGVAGASGANGFDMGIAATNLWRSRAYQSTASTNAMAGEKFLYSFRDSSGSVGHQRNLTLSNTSTGLSAVPSLPVFIGARNTNGAASLHWGRQIGAGWATNGVLSVPQRTVLFNAMSAFDSGRSTL